MKTPDIKVSSIIHKAVVKVARPSMLDRQGIKKHVNKRFIELFMDGSLDGLLFPLKKKLINQISKDAPSVVDEEDMDQNYVDAIALIMNIKRDRG